MTLASEVTKVQYAGNGSTTEFAVTFIFFDDADLRVILTVDSTGVETVQTISTNYTLVGGDGSTGTLTMVVAPASGETLTIKSDLDDIQDTALPLGGRFPSTTVEERFDKLTRLIQQKQEELSRSIKLAESSATTGIILPEPSAKKGLIWNDAGTNLKNSTNNLDDIAVNAAASAAAALVSENACAADLVLTNADVVSTNADVVSTNADVVSTNADVVSTNADVVLTNADVVTANNVVGAVASQYVFNTTTAMADPTTGLFRLNNATPASVTAIALDDLTNATGNPDISAFLATWDDSTNTVKGQLTIVQEDDPTKFMVFNITGLTDNSGWVQLAVTHVAGTTLFGSAKTCRVQFARSGDAGLKDVTTKGDLQTFSTVGARLPVAANGRILTPDSGEATGLKYTDAIKFDSNFIDTTHAGTAQFAAGEGIVLNGDSIDAAHTLDDYEEGTFTPILADNTSSDEGATYSVNNGKYTKIGNLVSWEIIMTVTGLGTLTTSEPARIIGMPFTAATDSTAFCGRATSLSLGTAGHNVTAYIVGTTAILLLQHWDGTGGTSGLLISEITSSGSFTVNGDYYV